MVNKVQITDYLQAFPWKDYSLQANKYLPTLVLGVLVLFLVQLAADITWKLLMPAAESSFTTSSQPSSNVITPSISLNDVSQYHLFGDAKKQAVVEQKIIDAPETRLKLSLKGVFSSSDSKQSLAIISDSKDKEETYHIGDEVSGGAVLHAVYDDRVILKRNGRLETLRLPKLKIDDSNLYDKNAVNDIRPETSISPEPSDETHTKLRNIRDTLLTDPAKIWKEVRINPVMKDGQVRGYSFTHNDQELMKSLDIRKTDIILQINGEPLSDPSSLYGLMNTLSTQQTFDVTIERDGQQQSIQLNFN